MLALLAQSSNGKKEAQFTSILKDKENIIESSQKKTEQVTEELIAANARNDDNEGLIQTLKSNFASAQILVTDANERAEDSKNSATANEELVEGLISAQVNNREEANAR